MVAVKILHDAEVGSVNFVREIAILKGCRHTNIVQFQVCPLKPTTLSSTPDAAQMLGAPMDTPVSAW